MSIIIDLIVHCSYIFGFSMNEIVFFFFFFFSLKKVVEQIVDVVL